ncbi:hypothetical protein LNTAR_19382 [Lentisphaera araneosa HTCC2155]|uniref:Uncharacterized protein n=1 Tax=Lentisphaera araneosa HTCC2155 TaxID=313628 RepID=A6DQU2_9BACT|nr:hypothetical protein [Lentisphaera araneosa]EDM25992.1 hypothetical protein LNTAR_19382 [Lentisphaera araneosa HTCC2155]
MKIFAVITIIIVLILSAFIGLNVFIKNIYEETKAQDDSITFTLKEVDQSDQVFIDNITSTWEETRLKDNLVEMVIQNQKTKPSMDAVILLFTSKMDNYSYFKWERNMKHIAEGSVRSIVQLYCNDQIIYHSKKQNYVYIKSKNIIHYYTVSGNKILEIKYEKKI